MARLFFHKPMFGVLDECTNATSVDVEEALYQHARNLNITLLTITQRAALLKYHDSELRLLDGEGDWEIREIRFDSISASANTLNLTPSRCLQASHHKLSGTYN
jgi:ABC-type uncharacterized transport system fused permease/ATPase subunit